MWDVIRRVGFFRVRSLGWASGWGTLCLLAACTCEQAYAPTPAATTAAAAVPSSAGGAASDGAPTDAPPGVAPLSEEDIRIINADPATLTPEERRKRPFALRRKIMQDPDSPAAKSLEDLRKAIESGEIDPSGGLIKFEARSGKAEPPSDGGPRPAGSRPPTAPDTPSAQ